MATLQTVWTQIRSNKVSVLIWIQTVWHSDYYSKMLIMNKISRLQKCMQSYPCSRNKLAADKIAIEDLSKNVCYNFYPHEPTPSSHIINTVMKKRDLFPTNEIDLKLNKTAIFFLSIENFRILEMLFDSLYIYLRHTLSIVHWNNFKDWFYVKFVLKLKKCPFSSLQIILNCLA